jgi:hypothetical protein
MVVILASRRPQKRHGVAFRPSAPRPKAIYALASGKYDDEVVELVLSAAPSNAVKC